MTVLIIGGAYQGKLDYARSLACFQENVKNGNELDKAGFRGAACVDRLHLFVKRLLDEGDEPEEITSFITENASGKILICDDICGGIVPVNRDENLWRETTGRTLCELTKLAGTVVRMQCGIPGTIKGPPLC